MKIELRRLTLAALVLSTSATFSGVAAAQNFVGDSEAEYYGTPSGLASPSTDKPLPPAVEPAVGNEDIWIPAGAASAAVRQVSASMYIGDDVKPVSDSTTSPSDHYHYDAPLHGHATSAAFGGVCDSSCDHGFGKIGKSICVDDPNVWFKSELLLWFPQSRNTPPLGAANAPGGAPPVLFPAGGFAAATPFADNFGGNLVPGFRGDIGAYFADGTFGLGGRAWVIGDDKETMNYGGSGADLALGIPFFNINPDPLLFGENAIFIGFNDGVPRAQGDVSIRSSLSIVAAELYGRALVTKSKNHRFELLGGYSHFNITDELGIRVNSIELPGGVQTVFNDSFRTRNEFNGGQIGSEISLARGRWTASSLTKVHMGNMSQLVRVSGTTAQGLLPGNPVVVAPADGLFARGETLDLDGFKRNVFAFAPEMNLKLGYQFRDHVNLHVGYTFVYWNNVMLAGDQIDRNVFIDPADFTANDTPRHVQARSTGYFVQGIDLGATITF